ncbi:MAG: alanine dehydrogenase, partial [Deltaproteobacteria bacterium]|nr:alanine dehydrogenase [Deltaproteobacteria bacterium]
DQGGCVETIRPTTHQYPIYKKYGVLHYGVTNMPSLVSRTATHSLCLASLPYVSRIAGLGIERAFQEDGGLQKAALF